MLNKIIDAIVWMYKAIVVLTYVFAILLLFSIPWVIACESGLTIGSAIVCLVFNLLWFIFLAGMLLEG